MILLPSTVTAKALLERDKELYQYTYEDITAMLRENMKSTNVEETIRPFLGYVHRGCFDRQF